MTLIACLLGYSSGVHALVFSLDPANQLAMNGDVVLLDLVASELGADTIGVFDIDVGYDSNKLMLDGLSYSGELGDIGLGEAIDLGLGDDGLGTLNLAVLSLLENDSLTCVLCFAPFLEDLQSSANVVLATLGFKVIDLVGGTSTEVGIDAVHSLGDGFGFPIFADSLSAATIVGEDAVVGVPEPGTLGLLLLSLGILLGRRWLE